MKAAIRWVLAVGLWVAACGDDAGDDGTTQTGDAGLDASLDASSPARSDGRSPSGELTDDAGLDRPDAAATPARSEAQLFGIATASYNLEIAAGEMASNRATDPAVVAYAQAMVSAFSAAQARALALDIKPEDSSDATAFVAMATALVQSVAEASEDFDRKYLQAEVTLHTAELQQLDTLLLPNATPKLAPELTTVRGEIAGHLQQAQALLAK